MKSYIVDRSGLAPQLNEMPTNVEKIYPTKADAEAALANGDIADGEFVSTVDTVTETGDKFDKSYLSYSTEETLTGGTWIDGKPIYRKVVPISNIGNVTAGQTFSITFDRTGVEDVINADTVFKNSVGNDYPHWGIVTSVISNSIIINWLNTGTLSSGYVILEYTKQ